MKKIAVYLVDDSALVRQLTAELLSHEPDMFLAGSAPDPQAARQKLQTFRPDVILLDIEMPLMDGLDFLRILHKDPQTANIPILMFSSLTERGCHHTLEALERGAVDFVTKPKLDLRRSFADLGSELARKIRAAALSKTAPPIHLPETLSTTSPLNPKIHTGQTYPFQLIAIACSTGGTEALRQIFGVLPATLPPIAIVQHMPERFTNAFAKRLDALGQVRVKEAEDSDKLTPGHAYIARGNQHLELMSLGGNLRLRLSSGPQVNGHRPSADVLFHSCARVAGRQTLGVILTGMGNDGAKGLLALRQSGAYTIAQNEATSVVFGMPKEAIQAGAACTVLPLVAIAQYLVQPHPVAA